MTSTSRMFILKSLWLKIIFLLLRVLTMIINAQNMILHTSRLTTLSLSFFKKQPVHIFFFSVFIQYSFFTSHDIASQIQIKPFCGLLNVYLLKLNTSFHFHYSVYSTWNFIFLVIYFLKIMSPCFSKNELT